MIDFMVPQRGFEPLTHALRMQLFSATFCRKLQPQSIKIDSFRSCAFVVLFQQNQQGSHRCSVQIPAQSVYLTTPSYVNEGVGSNEMSPLRRPSIIKRPLPQISQVPHPLMGSQEAGDDVARAASRALQPRTDVVDVKVIAQGNAKALEAQACVTPTSLASAAITVAIVDLGQGGIAVHR